MLISQESNIAELYRNALYDVMRHGSETKPRGFICRELSPYTLILTDPTKNILDDHVRKINKGFAAAEFMWIWNGRNDLEYLTRFNSKMAQFSDDGKTLWGAYGPRIFLQLKYILDTLEKDMWSRQAVLTIWRENPPKTKDVPCTINLHFMRRPIDTLNLIVYMRSNDIWLGLPYDIHTFTCLQIAVANILNLKIGTYTQVDGSLHAYSQDYEKIKNCIANLTNSDYDVTIPSTMFEQKYKIMDEYLKRKDDNYHNKNG